MSEALRTSTGGQYRVQGKEGGRDGPPLEKEMATHSSILAWRIPWTEELGRLQSMGCKVLDTTEGFSLHFDTLAGRICYYCLIVEDPELEVIQLRHDF